MNVQHLSWVWSSAAGRTVRAVQVVLLIWTDGRWEVPLGLRLWRKGGASKVALAEQMLREAKRRGARPGCVLFDSWYAASSPWNLPEGMGGKDVARLKSDRLLDAQAVRERWPHRSGHARGRLRKVSHEVLAVKDGRRYFVTNDTGRSAREVRRLYRHRQQIEEVFRLLKREFGWGGASAQKMQAQRAHLHPGLYALCLAERAAMLRGQTIYAFKRRLFRLPIPQHLPQLEKLPPAA